MLPDSYKRMLPPGDNKKVTSIDLAAGPDLTAFAVVYGSSGRVIHWESLGVTPTEERIQEILREYKETIGNLFNIGDAPLGNLS